MCSKTLEVKKKKCPENVSWITSETGEATGVPRASVYLLKGQPWRKTVKNNIYVNEGSAWKTKTQRT
jgi:hypothetical protein